MSLKVNILFLLALLASAPVSLASDKFLRVRGELIDLQSKEPISDYTIRLVEDDMDSTNYKIEGSEFEIWVQENRETKLYFIKNGYVTEYVWIDATFIRSWAHTKKQRVNNLYIALKTGTGRKKTPRFEITHDPKDNHFVVEDYQLKIEEKEANKFIPPFPSPADTYFDVKPINNRLSLTKTPDVKKAKGNVGRSKIIQGIMFADMSYCLFNQHVNEANDYLSFLRSLDPSVWDLKDFDSPEYGRIISRTLNREQSKDTLFALGMFVETTRLISQDFTSDRNVMVHLKMVKDVVANFSATSDDRKIQDFVKSIQALIPEIEKLEDDYKDHLRKKENFDLKEDEPFKQIKSKVEDIHHTFLS